jgi:hypothetical protein
LIFPSQRPSYKSPIRAELVLFYLRTEQLLKVVPSMYDFAVNRHIIDSTEVCHYRCNYTSRSNPCCSNMTLCAALLPFLWVLQFRQYHLHAQIECFVREFMGEVYDLESAKSYYVRPDFMICADRKGSGHGYTSESSSLFKNLLSLAGEMHRRTSVDAVFLLLTTLLPRLG